jgi:hypothetical protein
MIWTKNIFLIEKEKHNNGVLSDSLRSPQTPDVARVARAAESHVVVH